MRNRKIYWILIILLVLTVGILAACSSEGDLPNIRDQIRKQKKLCPLIQ